MTPKMTAALTALADLHDQRPGRWAFSPNEIGYEMGQPEGRRARMSNVHSRSSSPGSGFSSVLRGLQSRGLIAWSNRDDGWSGIAYRITDAGRDAIR
jgi:hypothetical protein